MSIMKRVKKSILDYQRGEIDNALIQAVISFDATAKKEGLTGGNADRCRKFLDKNRDIITRVAFGLLEIQGPLSLEYDDGSGNSKLLSIEDIIYKLIRCNLLHEAELAAGIEITDENSVGVGKDGKIHLPNTIVLGILIAVVGSPANKNGKLDLEFNFNINGANYPINEFWGKKEKILAVFRQHADAVGNKP